MRMNSTGSETDDDGASTVLKGGRGAHPVPDSLPLALAGLWVAWSADGMRIVASALTSDEALDLAHEAGEPEPILQRHSGRHRP